MIKMYWLYCWMLILLLIVINALKPPASTIPSTVLLNNEQTYIMIKPDGVQRRIVGDIIRRFEAKGYILKALKLTTPTREVLEEHYKELKNEYFFPRIMNFMSSGPVVAMVWEGKNAVRTCRNMLGATDPVEALTGTIRGDYAVDVKRNICHCSDSVQNAEREISLWFKEGIIDYTSHSTAWLYDDK